MERSVVESVRNLAICAGVRHAHPTHADNANANCLFPLHFSFTLRQLLFRCPHVVVSLVCGSTGRAFPGPPLGIFSPVISTSSK